MMEKAGRAISEIRCVHALCRLSLLSVGNCRIRIRICSWFGNNLIGIIVVITVVRVRISWTGKRYQRGLLLVLVEVM